MVNAYMGGLRVGTGGVGPPPWKITSCYMSLLGNTCTDPLEKKLDPSSLGPIASKERSIQPSVKYVDD